MEYLPIVPAELLNRTYIELDLLQGYDIASCEVLSLVNHSIGSISDLIYSLVIRNS